MPTVHVEPEAANELERLRATAETAADFQLLAVLSRARADTYSFQLAENLAEREHLRPAGKERRAAARRQVLNESITWCRAMSARWNDLAEAYDRKAKEL